MKNYKEFLPSIPSIPKAPKPPVRPKSNKSAEVPSIPGGGMPDFIKNKISDVSGNKISGGVAGVKKQISLTSAKVNQLIRDFPLDKYRDENGNIKCPVSKEERAKLLSILED